MLFPSGCKMCGMMCGGNCYKVDAPLKATATHSEDVVRQILKARNDALDQAADAIMAKHTNNVGMVHPMAISDAEFIRSLKSN